MLLVLTIISILVILAFFAVLIVYLLQIATTLERIGGKSGSLLSRLGPGLRTIEQETGNLPGAIAQINHSLSAIEGGLARVDEHLSAASETVVQQEKK